MWLQSNLLRKGLFLSAIFFLGVLFSCKEEGELVPEFNASSLDVLDTVITVTSTTVYGDSIRTDRVSRTLFGKLNDQTFGLSSSEFYAQFLMPSTSLNTDPLIPDDIDSVVLVLAYDGAYGYSSTHDIIVHELSDTLGSNSEYYSDDSVETKSKILGRGRITLDPSILTDSVVRIRLSDELGRRIVNPDSGGGEFSSQTEWLEFFKGIKVSVSGADPIQGDGSIIYFNLLDSKTKLNVYFTSPGDSSLFSFIVPSEAQRFAHFDHDHSGTALETDVESTVSAQSNYLASLSSSRIRLSFDDLEQLAADLGTIAINRAEFILPYEEPIITQYSPPDKTVVIMKGDEGTWILPIDWTKNGSDYFGGELELVSKQYKFTLTSTFHEMINLGDYERNLFLSVSGNSVVANRVIMNSGVHQKRKMYVHLTYTKK